MWRDNVTIVIISKLKCDSETPKHLIPLLARGQLFYLNKINNYDTG